MGLGKQLAAMGMIRLAVTTVRSLNRRFAKGPLLKVEDRLWQGWYDAVLRLSRHMAGEFEFQNYGFQKTQENLAIAEDGQEACCAQLYDNLVSGSEFTSLEGKHVLDVGCGKGGGCAYIGRVFRPETMTGLDISGEAIDFCRNRYGQNHNLQFVSGTCTDLPFAEKAFDVVTNVESSNHYADCSGFLSQVKRVLKPGGHFLFADWRPAGEVSVLDSLLAENFEVVKKEDITEQVVNALDVDSDRRRRLVTESKSLQKYGRSFQRILVNFAGAKGGRRYQGFAERDLLYVAYWMRNRGAEA
jgi:ubiquinone/menaquinone biosynthesis C-methylase UbiE